MKNWKNGQGLNKDEEKLRFIFESRLALQSTQRYLDKYNISKKSFDYFMSENFIKNYFMTWTEFQKKNFLIKMAGDYWKKLQEMLVKD